jgi:threonine dehydratase
MVRIPTFEEIQIAHERIKPYIHHTPVFTSETINRLTKSQVFFKCENFQKVGAFKMRGAANAVLSLTSAEKQNGVATHSSGNHAQALALAAKQSNIQAYIVMPESAPQIKRKAVLDYGATVINCAPTLSARELALNEVVKETGAVFIHPYDNVAVIAGQATALIEFHNSIPDLDIIMCPVGGGGLISGTALAASYLYPTAKIIGGEPKGADDAFNSLRAGKIINIKDPLTIADGLLATVGPITFNIIQKYVHQIITVEEEEIIDAMRLVWERMKIIIEPSAAVPVAALLKDMGKFSGLKVGIIISGGNVDLDNLPFLKS